MASPLIPWNMSTMVEAEGSGSRTGGWTLGQDEAFEIAQATVDMEEGEAAWNKIADTVEGKTAEDVKRRYELLVEDVDAILAGSVPLPVYADDDWVLEEGCFGDGRKDIYRVEGQGGFGDGRKGISGVGEGQGGFSDGRKGVSGVGEGQGGFGDGRKGVSVVGEGQGGFGDGRKGVSGVGEGHGRHGEKVPFKSVEQGRWKGNFWTEDEHRLFLLGLEKYGKGDWRSISRNFVISRTPTQVASHAQKYFIRLNSMNRERRRSSIHDITSVNGEASSAQGPITGTNGQAAVPGKSPKHSPQPGTLPPGVDAFGTTIGQPVGGPLVSAVGTPVTLPVPAPPHMGYAMHAPVPGTVVPRPPMCPMPPPPSR